MEADQTICPKCSFPYSEENPPRLLTMCGHTLCEKCITSIIPPKKTNRKYKVVCPIDDVEGEIITPSAASFPKNIAIMHLVAREHKKDR